LVTRVTLFLLLTCTAAFAQQPRIGGLSPSQGPIAGGTIVTIRGANFTGATVTIDRSPITPLSRTDSEVRVTMPKHDNGYGVIAVGNAYGEFLYLPPRLQDLPPGYVTTIAGVGSWQGDYRPATQTSLSPLGMAFDRSGNLYIADTGNNRIVRVRPDGIMEPFAGKSVGGTSASPFPALEVRINFPRSVVVDSRGRVVAPDTSAYRLWRTDPATGIAESIAGTGREAYSGDDGPAVNAAIGHTGFLTIDAADNIYFIDWTSARVRKINAAGIITTIAGDGTFGFSGDDGPATSARFNLIFADEGSLAVDSHGNVFLADTGNRRVRRIDAATGVITTVVGPTVNGKQIRDLRIVAVDRNDVLYFAGYSGDVYRLETSGSITPLNPGRDGFSEDGTTFGAAALRTIGGIAFDASNAMHYSHNTEGRIRRVDPATTRISTIAGSGPRQLGEGGPALAGVIDLDADDVDVLPSGEIVFTDIWRIRKIDRSGNLVTIAGNPSASFSQGTGPIPALDAKLAANSVFVAEDGSILITDDVSAGKVFRLAGGVLTHLAGGKSRCGLDGDSAAATEADLCQPWDVIRDRDGNLLIADSNNNRIRRVDAKSGVISTIVGAGAPPNGFERYFQGRQCGDGGPAFDACLNTPMGLALDPAGNLLIADHGAIRRVDTTGRISTLAPNWYARKVTTDRNGYVYAGDYARIDRFDAEGHGTRLAGIGFGPEGGGFAGDGGPASEAQFREIFGLAIDREGNLYVGDGQNRRIRGIRYGAVLAPPGATIQATANGSIIRATVFDAAGHPAPSVRVDFTAPTSAASCILSSPFGVTDANGVAVVGCASNCIAGTFSVTAQPVNVSSIATVSFTNSGGPCRRRAARH
jgi:sugar lactone lactonase YvrE